MKAMILAAGLGTRLKPLTNHVPKALVNIEGVPILERVILKLKSQGFDRLVVNVHHFSRQIIDFLDSRDFGLEIKVSDESDKLYDTGGGIVRAMPLLFGADRSPVLIHNVDILSNADLPSLMGREEEGSFLLVSDRESSRKLIFDEKLKLRAWENVVSGEIRPGGIEIQAGWASYAFSGIYTLTYEAVEEMKKMYGENKFPVMDYFLDPRRKESIYGRIDPDLRLLDIGKPTTLSQAPEFIN